MKIKTKIILLALSKSLAACKSEKNNSTQDSSFTSMGVRSGEGASGVPDCYNQTQYSTLITNYK